MRVRSRRRRRSDQSRLDVTDATNTSLDLSQDHHHHHHHHSLDTHHHHHHHSLDTHHHHHHHSLDTHHHHHIPEPSQYTTKDHQQAEDHHCYTLEHQHPPEHEQTKRTEDLVEELGRRSGTPRRRKKETVVTKVETSRTTVRRSPSESNSNGGPHQQLEGNTGIGSIAESVKNSVLGFFTPTKSPTLSSISESSESGFEEGNVTGSTVWASSPRSEHFVSAQEFFKDADTRERLPFNYFSGTDTPSKLKESTRRLSTRKPYNPYIAYSSDEELDDWQKQPKSDYTYSASLTYRDRVTPDRKVGSPNMSRRSLRGGNVGYFASPDFTSRDVEPSSRLDLRSRTVIRPMDTLSDASDGEETPQLAGTARRLRSSRSRSIDVMPRSNGLTVSQTISTTSYTTTRTLHGGLDVDSDTEDGTVSAVPSRATPLTARSGTPLGRATTPLGRSSVAKESITRRGGYTLAKGAIAEDIEDDEAPKNVVVTWSKKSWEVVRRTMAVITTTIVMLATTAVASTSRTSEESNVNSAPNKLAGDDADFAEEKLLASKEKSSLSSSFVTGITTRTRSIITTTTEYFETTRERVRKNPILLWIPLLIFLILLALIAYWWLLMSRAKTEPDEASFLTLALTSVYDLTTWTVSSLSWACSQAWQSIVIWCAWFGGTCREGLAYTWTSTMSMFLWLGSVLHSCLAYMLDLLYIVLGFLQYAVLAVLSFLSSGASYLSGFLFPVFATTNNTDETKTATEEDQAWTFISLATVPLKWASDGLGWAAGLVTKESLSEVYTNTYTSVSEVTQASGTWFWNGWLWLVVSLGEVLTATASYIQWAVYGSLSFLAYLVLGLWNILSYLALSLWNILAYLVLGLVALLTSAASTMSSAAIETSSAVANTAKTIVVPFFAFETKTEEVIVKTTPAPKVDPVIQGKDLSVLEIVERVLQSNELKILVDNAAMESSTKGQLTMDDVSVLVKSVVEGELSSFRAETEQLQENINSKIETSEESYNYVLLLKEHQEHLIRQLDELGARLLRMEGSSEVSQQQLPLQLQQNEEQLLALKKEIEQLGVQLDQLQTEHSSLAAEVKGCCKNTSVTLADVERHVTTLLGDILGLPPKPSGDSEEEEPGVGASWTAGDMAAWLKSYFVAKDELETRLDQLTSTMQLKAAEGDEAEVSSATLVQLTVAQTTQMVMDTVLEKLRAEILQQHTHFTQQAQQQVAEQVNLQVQAAAEVLGTQVADQVQHRFETSKQHLSEHVAAAVKESVPEAINSMVPEFVAEAVPDLVAAAVPDAVKEAVPGIVDAAVEVAVSKAVPEAVEISVTSAVTKAVDEVIPEAVLNAVPQAVEKALPHAVDEAVKDALPEIVSAKVSEAVAVAVPEVVASALPAVVQTVVNDTMSSVVSAEVDVKLSKAGVQISQVNSEGDGVIVVGGSSTSDAGGQGRVSATVNISENLNNGSNFSFVPSGTLSAGLNESAVIQIVKDALMKYDADKTGMVDHALETAGGNIISTRCTESYHVHQAEISILGFPIYRYSTNNPRTIIQPGRMPGQCWAFKGSQGYVVIQLAGPVRPTGFSLEHIPKSLSPSGEIDSAPREFEVWGLQTESDEGMRLGTFEYKQNGEPLQFFPVSEENAQYFNLIELKINNNHGNLQYTCIYRFRVHGLRYLG